MEQVYSSYSEVLYIIFSNYSIAKIRQILENKNIVVGTLKVLYDKYGTETNRTLAVLKNVNNLESLSDAKFQVKPFTLKKVNKETRELFIPVPKTFCKESEVREHITELLNFLNIWMIIPENSWKLYIPLESRISGNVKFGCFLSFNNNVSNENINIVRLLINDTQWENGETLRCYWKKEKLRLPPKQKVIEKTN